MLFVIFTQTNRKMREIQMFLKTIYTGVENKDIIEFNTRDVLGYLKKISRSSR